MHDTQFSTISGENLHRASIALFECLPRWNALYGGWSQPAARASELSGSSSSGALHENCGHVPEVKTQPQNTDRITRRITLDYIPLSKGACQTKPGKGRGRGSKIQEIPSRKSLSAPRPLLAAIAARYTATSTNWGRTGTTLGILEIICTQSVGRAAGTRKRKRE